MFGRIKKLLNVLHVMIACLMCLNVVGLKKLRDENSGSAIGFVLGIFILILITINLLPSLSYQAATVSANASVAAVGGAVAMISILVLLFIVLPVIVVAKAL